MPGPAPKKPEHRIRANTTPATTKLPAEGRTGDPPRWPLPNPGGEELSVWSELWATPQAVAWERLGWTRIVARYARALVEAEKRDATAALMAEVRQVEDRLGLTPMSMLRLRWEVVADEVAEQRQQQSTSARGRIRAVG